MDKNYKIGVIIARLQVAELHEGHKALINKVSALSNEVIIFLGTSVTKGGRKNTLNYETRKLMVLETFPFVSVYSLPDKRYDEVWSENVDKIIESISNNKAEVTLYGSRDSFKSHYSGKYEVVELLDVAVEGISGTQDRLKIAEKPENSAAFRRGYIYGAYDNYDISFPTVDVAIFNDDYSKLLLGKKPDEKLFRFIGGFINRGENHKTAVRREAAEETGLVVDGLKHIDSFVINDWRYRGSNDGILTTFYKGKVIMGHEKAADDIEELKWFDITTITDEEIMEEHRPLLKALKENLHLEIEFETKN